MRLSSNTVTESVVRQIQQLSSNQISLQARVASNQRITNPSDDAASVRRVITLESERRNLTQFEQNGQRALELSQGVYSALQQMKKMSDRATEIATLGTGALSKEARNAYASELDQILEQAVQVGNTKLRNEYLFAGTALDTAPLAVTRDANGQVTASSYAGNSDQLEIAISDSSVIKPGTTGATNQNLNAFINGLVALRDSLKNSDSAGVSTATAALIESEDQLVDSLAAQGSVQMRLEVHQALQRDRTDNVEQLISGEVDDDMAATIVRLNQTQVAYQAALQSSANIMRLSLLDYIK